MFRIKAALEAGGDQTDADMNALRVGAVLLRIAKEEEAAALTSSSDNLGAVIDEAIYKLDIIPAGRALCRKLCRKLRSKTTWNSMFP